MSLENEKISGILVGKCQKCEEKNELLCVTRRKNRVFSVNLAYLR